MSEGSILVEIKGSGKELLDSFKEVKNEARSLENQLAFTAKASGIAFAALTAEVGFAVHAFAQQEVATNKLSQALQNQGIYSKETVEVYRAQAEALEELTGVDAEQIVQGQAIAQALIGRVKISKELTQAAVDLSTQTGSVQSAFEILGRGIEGNTKGLKGFGITIDENLTKQERMAKILEVVTQKFGGQAEASSQGLAGISRLSNSFENLQKAIGEKFAPVVTQAIDGITKLFNAISQNKPLIAVIAALLAAGVAATGFIAALSGLGVALIAATQLAGAFGFTLTAALGPIGLASVAIGALGGALGLYITRAREADEETKQLETRIKNMRDAVVRYQSIVDHPTGHAFVDDKALKNLDEAKAKLAGFEAQLAKIKKTREDSQEKSDDKADQAEKKEQEDRSREARRIAALKAHNQLVHLQSVQASKDAIELKREEVEILDKINDEKYKSERAALQKHLADIRTLQTTQDSLDAKRQAQFDKVALKENEAFHKLSLAEQKEFLLKKRAGLLGTIETEETVRQNAALAEATQQISAHNTFLAEQEKYGTAYAAINQAMHSAVVQGTSQAFGELAILQSSSNATLKAIGQGAAIANIVIKTAESAMNIYAGFSTIPIIGPVLGVAGAAAAVAFGAEQIGKVTAAADGGILTGGIPGRDSIPVLGMPGELVVPTKNYEEVVGAVASQRLAEKETSQRAADLQRGGPGSMATVVLQLKGELVKFVEASIIERQRLGISLLPRFT